ncbi:unnamed protein product, partial [Laminaria digitata]
QQQAALDELRKGLTCESVDLTPLLGDGTSCPPEDADLALLRFLRHNDWDVEQTRAQMVASLSWRVETGVTAALRREPWEASRCSSEETFEKLCQAHYPHYTIGADRQGRPVLVQKYGTFNTHKLKQCTTLDGLLAYHAWEQEKNAELLRRSTARTGHLTETYSVIMDFKGMGIGLVGGDFVWLLGQLAEMDRKHYPGRGGVIYVINTPPLFGMVWKGISQVMMATKARICIFSNEREWKAALAEAIDSSQLPKEYGGTAPALADTPLLHAVHRALERDAAATALGATSGGDAAAVAAAETVSAAAAIGQLDGEAAVGATSDGVVAAKTMAAILLHFSLDAHENNFSRTNCIVKGSLEGDDDDGCGSGGSAGDPVTKTSKSQMTTSDPPTPGSEDLSGSDDLSEPEDLPGSDNLSGSDDLSGSEYLSGSEDLSGSRDQSESQDLSGLSDLSGSEDLSGTEDLSATSERSTPTIARAAGHETRDAKQCDGGGFECVLKFIPGARLATGITVAVVGNTFGAALTVAGFTAGVIEAVVPEVAWAEGVRAFEESQFWGRRSCGGH